MTRNATVQAAAEGCCGFGVKALGKAGMFVAAAGMGAGLMYFLDPNRGKARRAMVADKAGHLKRACEEKYEKYRKDAANRVAGVEAELRRALEPEEAPTDQKLAARVKTRLGRVTKHAHGIHVMADHGKVTLTGEAFAGEAKRIVEAVGAVAGVACVDNRMTLREAPEKALHFNGRLAIPALAGLGAGVAAAVEAFRHR